MDRAPPDCPGTSNGNKWRRLARPPAPPLTQCSTLTIRETHYPHNSPYGTGPSGNFQVGASLQQSVPQKEKLLIDAWATAKLGDDHWFATRSLARLLFLAHTLSLCARRYDRQQKINWIKVKTSEQALVLQEELTDALKGLPRSFPISLTPDWHTNMAKLDLKSKPVMTYKQTTEQLTLEEGTFDLKDFLKETGFFGVQFSPMHIYKAHEGAPSTDDKLIEVKSLCDYWGWSLQEAE